MMNHRQEQLIFSFPIQKGLIWAIKERKTKREEKIKKSPSEHLRRKGKGRRRKGNSYSIEHNNSLHLTRDAR
jgi:hypothetical protein